MEFVDPVLGIMKDAFQKLLATRDQIPREENEKYLEEYQKKIAELKVKHDDLEGKLLNLVRTIKENKPEGGEEISKRISEIQSKIQEKTALKERTKGVYYVESPGENLTEEEKEKKARETWGDPIIKACLAMLEAIDFEIKTNEEELKKIDQEAQEKIEEVNKLNQKTQEEVMVIWVEYCTVRMTISFRFLPFGSKTPKEWPQLEDVPEELKEFIDPRRMFSFDSLSKKRPGPPLETKDPKAQKTEEPKKTEAHKSQAKPQLGPRSGPPEPLKKKV